MSRETLIIGHRGASRDAPENTLASFRLAFEQEADGIEADFRLTGDGRIVCLHDGNTSRTCGAPLEVAQSTLDELRRLDAGVWKGEGWKGEAIPTLQEVLAALPAGKKLYVEVKSGLEILAPLQAEIEACAASPRQVMFLCFDAGLVRALKERIPSHRACWLTDYRWRGSWRPSPQQVLDTLERCGADGLASRDRAVLDADLVRQLRERDLEIHVWTVDAAARASRLTALGVDTIMTNRPGWLRRRLASAAGGPS